MAEKVTRLLPSQGLNRDQHDCLARLASLCGKVRTDARHRCSGVSTAPQSPYDLRDAWMAEGCARHGLPARWGKATLAAAMSPRPSAREVAKVPVRRPCGTAPGATTPNASVCTACSSRTAGPRIRFCTGRCGNSGRAASQSHVANEIVVDAGSYTTKV